MDRLSELESNSIYIIREAFATWRKSALLWSMGKDSTALLWIIRKAFFGKIPFPVIHIDTGYKFPEIYSFRDYYASLWGLDLLIARNTAAQKKGIGPDKSKFACCTQLKTVALKHLLSEKKLEALFLAIRRDEHGIRAKERVFSPRNAQFKWDYEHQPAELWNHHEHAVCRDNHVRVHPLLAWQEIDVWRYIQRERIPVVSLYLAQGGKRYRSIGCECCCKPAVSSASSIRGIISDIKTSHISERSGRAQDKEEIHTMEKLRALGYM